MLTVKCTWALARKKAPHSVRWIIIRTCFGCCLGKYYRHLMSLDLRRRATSQLFVVMIMQDEGFVVSGFGANLQLSKRLEK